MRALRRAVHDVQLLHPTSVRHASELIDALGYIADSVR